MAHHALLLFIPKLGSLAGLTSLFLASVPIMMGFFISLMCDDDDDENDIILKTTSLISVRSNCYIYFFPLLIQLLIVLIGRKWRHVSMQL